MAVRRGDGGTGALETHAGELHGHTRERGAALVGDCPLDRSRRLCKNSDRSDEEKAYRENETNSVHRLHPFLLVKTSSQTQTLQSNRIESNVTARIFQELEAL